jgi:uncharacterized RDD family membrane protein YckC
MFIVNYYTFVKREFKLKLALKEVYNMPKMNTNILSRSSIIIRRLIAAFVEIALLSCFAVYLILTLPEISNEPSIAFEQGAYFIFVLVLWLGILTYMLFKDALFNGQSIMKKILRLRVVGLDTQIKCRWYQSLFRNFILFIPFIAVIELLMIVFVPSGRRLGDFLAGTAVIDAREPFFPKPKQQKKLREIGLKTITWLLAAGLMLALFYIIYNSIGAGNLSEKLDTSSDSVVTIYAYDNSKRFLGYASGFFVNSDGYVVTNQHVIEGAATAYVVYRQKENLVVDSVVANDPTKDIVILKVRIIDTPFLKLGNSDKLEVGSEIYTIGAPQGLMNTVSKGIISQLRFIKGTKFIQIDAPISPGSSGGPLLDKNLEVIGVNFAYYKEGQNLNFAIPVNYVKALLKKAKVSYK